tara:strand:- start:2194 stop:2793 length:600 start_codon:yes stop_codon:yes gene_type:complete
MGNMFSNTLVEMVNKCDKEGEGKCDGSEKIDGKRITISTVDLRDVPYGGTSDVQQSVMSGGDHDEMNYIVRLNKNDNCDGQLNIQYKCGVPDDIDNSADNNDDSAATDAASTDDTDAASTDATDAATDDATDAASTDATDAASTDAASTDATDAATDAATATTSSQEGFTNNIDDRCILLVLILFTLWIYRKNILKILK